jgi:hypothetical protein
MELEYRGCTIFSGATAGTPSDLHLRTQVESWAINRGGGSDDLDYGDDSAIPVPGIFKFVPSMPVVVNQNIHQRLKLVNGASYTALDVILSGNDLWISCHYLSSWDTTW